MIRRLKVAVVQDGLTREFGQGILLVGLTGSSVGGLLGILAIASRALGR
jgi:hypothetical protein